MWDGNVVDGQGTENARQGESGMVRRKWKVMADYKFYTPFLQQQFWKKFS